MFLHAAEFFIIFGNRRLSCYRNLRPIHCSYSFFTSKNGLIAKLDDPVNISGITICHRGNESIEDQTVIQDRAERIRITVAGNVHNIIGSDHLLLLRRKYSIFICVSCKIFKVCLVVVFCYCIEGILLI